MKSAYENRGGINEHLGEFGKIFSWVLQSEIKLLVLYWEKPKKRKRRRKKMKLEV